MRRHGRAATRMSIVAILAVMAFAPRAPQSAEVMASATVPIAAAEAAQLELDVLVNTFEELSEAPPRRRDLGCRDPQSRQCELNLGRMGALYVDLLRRTRAIQRDELSPESRIDLDVLEWRTQLAVARYLDPDSNGFDQLGYAANILRHTGQVHEPSELHELGLQEIERIRTAMLDLVHAQDPDADLDAFLEAARTDARLFADSREELRSIARTIAAGIDRRLGAAFNGARAVPYSIELLRRGQRGFMAQYRYGHDGIRGRPAGYVVLNSDPRQVPLFLLEALLLHEAMPGHHLQTSWDTVHTERTSWRSRFAVTAFVEGWGLYAESLGADLGVYRHPMTEFGRLNLEMWRAIRLVVDTGLHAFDWDRRRAEELFREHTALPVEQIRIEVRRYEDNPGQAVAYKLGELKFRELRTHAEEALGSSFDLREFHDAVLAYGSIPLQSLDDQVDAWVTSAAQGS